MYTRPPFDSSALLAPRKAACIVVMIISRLSSLAEARPFLGSEATTAGSHHSFSRSNPSLSRPNVRDVLRKVGRQAWQDNLCLGSPNAGELHDNLRAIGCQNQPGVETRPNKNAPQLSCILRTGLIIVSTDWSTTLCGR